MSRRRVVSRTSTPNSMFDWLGTRLALPIDLMLMHTVRVQRTRRTQPPLIPCPSLPPPTRPHLALCPRARRTSRTSAIQSLVPAAIPPHPDGLAGTARRGKGLHEAAAG